MKKQVTIIWTFGGTQNCYLTDDEIMDMENSHNVSRVIVQE